MSSRASVEQTIFAEIDGFGPALSHDAFENCSRSSWSDGDAAPSSRCCRTRRAQSATRARTATTRTLAHRLNATDRVRRQRSASRAVEERLDRRDERRVAVDDEPAGRDGLVDATASAEHAKNAGNVTRSSARAGAGRPRCTRSPDDPSGAGDDAPDVRCRSRPARARRTPTPPDRTRRRRARGVGARSVSASGIDLARVEPTALHAQSRRRRDRRRAARASADRALARGRRDGADRRNAEQRADREPEAEPERDRDLARASTMSGPTVGQLRLPEVREIGEPAHQRRPSPRPAATPYSASARRRAHAPDRDRRPTHPHDHRDEVVAEELHGLRQLRTRARRPRRRSCARGRRRPARRAPRSRAAAARERATTTPSTNSPRDERQPRPPARSGHPVEPAVHHDVCAPYRNTTVHCGSIVWNAPGSRCTAAGGDVPIQWMRWSCQIAVCDPDTRCQRGGVDAPVPRAIAGTAS